MKKFPAVCTDCGISKEIFYNLNWKPYKDKVYRCTKCNTKYTVNLRREKSQHKSLTDGYVWESYESKGQKMLRTNIICPTCKKLHWVRKGNMVTRKKKNRWTDDCKKCIMHNTRDDKSFVWKGGVSITKGGYRLVHLCPDDPYYSMANGSRAESGAYAYEHRYVIAKSIGRSLSKNEDVHHINGIKTDNRLENLLLLDKVAHGKLHGSGRSYKS